MLSLPSFLSLSLSLNTSITTQALDKLREEFKADNESLAQSEAISILSLCDEMPDDQVNLIPEDQPKAVRLRERHLEEEQEKKKSAAKEQQLQAEKGALATALSAAQAFMGLGKGSNKAAESSRGETRKEDQNGLV